MKLYIIDLIDGASIIAKSYKNSIMDGVYITALSKKGTYDFTALRSEIIDIREVDSSDLPDNLKKDLSL